MWRACIPFFLWKSSLHLEWQYSSTVTAAPMSVVGKFQLPTLVKPLAPLLTYLHTPQWDRIRKNCAKNQVVLTTIPVLILGQWDILFHDFTCICFTDFFLMSHFWLLQHQHLQKSKGQKNIRETNGGQRCPIDLRFSKGMVTTIFSLWVCWQTLKNLKFLGWMWQTKMLWP